MKLTFLFSTSGSSFGYFTARTSAASTCGSFVRALRLCLRMTASENPASLNSRRKATPSFAPAIHANQFVSLARASGANGLERISSAANAVPPRLTTRASSRKLLLLNSCFSGRVPQACGSTWHRSCFVAAEATNRKDRSASAATWRPIRQS